MQVPQDLQDQIAGHTGFHPSAPPHGGAAAPPSPSTGQPGVFQFVIEVLLSPTRVDRPVLMFAIDRELP